nr:basic proline-rich protein-like [Aegilops tauschii subsp. strangulata]
MGPRGTAPSPPPTALCQIQGAGRQPLPSPPESATRTSSGHRPAPPAGSPATNPAGSGRNPARPQPPAPPPPRQIRRPPQPQRPHLEQDPPPPSAAAAASQQDDGLQPTPPQPAPPGGQIWPLQHGHAPPSTVPATQAAPACRRHQNAEPPHPHNVAPSRPPLRDAPARRSMPAQPPRARGRQRPAAVGTGRAMPGCPLAAAEQGKRRRRGRSKDLVALPVASRGRRGRGRERIV